MIIDERITVGMVNDVPKYIVWKNRSHTITKIGLHHHYKEGSILYHIFSCVSDTLFLRLKLNTNNLLWTLEEISDGI